MKSQTEQLLAASIEIVTLNKRLAAYEHENAYLLARCELAEAKLARLFARRNVYPIKQTG